MLDLLIIFGGIGPVFVAIYILMTKMAKEKYIKIMAEQKLYKVTINEFKYMALNNQPIHTGPHFILARNENEAKGVAKTYMQKHQGFEPEGKNIEVELKRNVLVSY